jgi:hypothetical protein
MPLCFLCGSLRPVFGARGFQNGSDNVLVLLINKIYFHLGGLAVRHVERHCLVDELLQVVDSGRLTFSAGMNLASRLEHETHATFVGEPTGSRPNHYGEAVTLTLPASGITVRVCSTRYWQDSKPNDKRLWIAPEMPAPPSAAAFSRGIDPAMDSISRALGHHHHSGSPGNAQQMKQRPLP